MRLMTLVLVIGACETTPSADIGGANSADDSDQAGLPVSETDQPEFFTSTIVEMRDLALETGFDDHHFGHFKRGRACVAGDYDGDGRIDVYMGSPGDESSVFRNQLVDGQWEFELMDVLSFDGVYWAGSAADYDNDGDWDLYQAGGGNEMVLKDRFWRNDGQFNFTDVSIESRLDAPIRAGKSIETASAGGNWADFNHDGWVDLFVSVNSVPMVAIMDSPSENRVGQNLLWKNNGDGTFTDVAEQSALTTRATTRHSSWIDVDNDGDLDLYENNYATDNVLWRNQMMEGSQNFSNITLNASLGGSSLASPRMSFASMVGDFNQDGWQDLLVLTRPGTDCSPESFLESEPGLLESGHALFINVEGTGFVDVTPHTGLNKGLAVDEGVMGCQVGDLDANGLLDVYIGNGGPAAGQNDQLFFGTHLATIDIQGVGDVVIPVFEDRTYLVDYPAEELAGQSYPSYPYRTHGTCMTDFDGDGLLELGVINGGPSAQPDFVREPNRLFKAVFDIPPNWLKVMVSGDGDQVHRDAFHTRVRVRVSTGVAGETRDLYNTYFSASAFSAQNGPEIFFGLADADTIHEIEITWPDGRVDLHQDVSGVNQTLTYTY